MNIHIIKPHNLFQCLFVLSAMLLGGCRAKTQSQNISKPNIVVILVDDAGYADFECYGGKEIPTPNINSLAAGGVKFTDAYVSASVCAPSRAGLITGKYQQRFGFEHNPSGTPSPGYTKADMGLDPAETTIADALKQNGYHSIAIGKWHLGNETKHFPLNRGFDEFYGFLAGHRSFFGYKGKKEKEEALLDNYREVNEDSITYLTDMFTNKAISFIDQNKQQPFFMYLAYNAVHTPMDAARKYWNQFDYIKDSGRRTYATMMASLDENIGRVFGALQKNNLEKNTLIVFLNDNGGATTNSSDNGPLRGMKGSKWEGGIRVAMMMKWPQYLPQQNVYTKSVSSLDIFATAVAAAGGKQNLNNGKDGVNLLPFIKGEKQQTPHQALFWRRGVAAAVREGDWKLIRVKSNPVLLFNLSNDLSETTNVADANPDIVKRLLHKLNQWEKGLSQPHWGSSYGEENQILKHRMNVIGRDMERKYP